MAAGPIRHVSLPLFVLGTMSNHHLVASQYDLTCLPLKIPPRTDCRTLFTLVILNYSRCLSKTKYFLTSHMLTPIVDLPFIITNARDQRAGPTHQTGAFDLPRVPAFSHAHLTSTY